MLKQSIIYFLLSVLVVIFARFAFFLIIYINILYSLVNVYLAQIFSQIGLSLVVQRVILLLCFSLLLAAVPTLIYRVAKGKMMPYFSELTWCIWLVILLSNILLKDYP
jgi:hypothetical protein